MATRSRLTIPDQLNAAQVAIHNTIADAEIQAAVAAYGYAPGRMAEGRRLHEAALFAVNAQKAATGAQREATARLLTAATAAQDAYQALAKVARAVFARDKTQLAALGLNRAMPRTTAGFLTAAYALFDNAAAVPGAKAALAGYGYDAAKLASERAKIAAFDAANRAQEAAKGAAQHATQEQDAALKQLTDWAAQFTKIAKVALRDKKQLLEKLGIKARTAKTAAQRGARKKAAAARAARKG